jgi:hypothetical protein
VVLPFTNLSNDPNQEYFADGVTENLTTDLSQIRNSFVIDRNTAFTFKGESVDAKEIGKELSVRYVLEDSVQRIALKKCPDPDRVRAEACFRKVIEIAQIQEARMLELRAATDLARLWRDIGSLNEPRTLLEPILALIEGGESTRDVRNARALLAEIA